MTNFNSYFVPNIPIAPWASLREERSPDLPVPKSVIASIESTYPLPNNSVLMNSSNPSAHHKTGTNRIVMQKGKRKKTIMAVLAETLIYSYSPASIIE